ncbi:MAG: NmrA family NAD(P)-binding protein, partial [Gammaproteobacteria bacterium]
MKAFVTGATGLLGNNLVRALRAEGHAVRALVRSETKAQRLLGDTGAELVRGDMENVA